MHVIEIPNEARHASTHGFGLGNAAATANRA